MTHPALSPTITTVLHAVWTADGRVGLWAEDGRRLAGSGGRHGAEAGAPDHPFAMSADDLVAAIRGVTGPTQATPDRLTVWLPSAGGKPLPSPDLLSARDGQAGPGQGSRSLWIVPVLVLAVPALLPVLGRLTGSTASLRSGPSLRYLAHVRQLVDVLAVQGEIRPALRQVDGAALAVWRPSGGSKGSAARMRETLGRCPASLLAAFEPETADGTSVAVMILDALVDAVARPLAAIETPPPWSAATPAERAAIAWLKALGPAGPAIAVSPKAVGELARSLGAWPAGTPEAKPRSGLGFRLVAPESPDGSWLLQFLLPDGRQATGLKQALWKAAKAYVPLNRAMEGMAITSLSLASDEALDFLSRGAAALQAAGIDVQVPSWRRSPPEALALHLQSEVRPSHRGSLCRFQWQGTLGGQALNDRDVRRLASSGSGLFLMQGTWVAIDADDRRRALAMMAATGPAGEMPVGEFIKLALADDTVAEAAADHSWLQGVLQRDRATLQPVAPSKALQAQLRDYQRRGLEWLSFMSGQGLGACLADDMGLGKTIQVLALLLAEREGGKQPGPTLLVCPTSVVGNWQREAARFAPSLRVLIHHGGDRSSGSVLAEQAAQQDVVVTTYGLAVRDQEALAAIAWQRVVLDEAQMIKNPATRQHKAVASLSAGHRLALTGTPVENRLADLWALMTFLNPGLLGSQTAFEKRFAQPIERGHDPDAAVELKRLTGPFILRRVKSDPTIARDLPEKLETTTYCTLTPEQATLYQSVVDDLMQHLGTADGMARRGHILGALTKLKQICDHPIQVLAEEGPLSGRSGKLERLTEMLDEVLACGEKALVFTQFATWADRLGAHLADRFGREVLVLTGSTPRAERDRMIERFGSAEGPPLFVLSLKAGGTGLNLMAANHVFHVDRWWNPAVEAQATDRAYRIGQHRNVQVHRMLCAGTVEERIDQLLEAKRDLADRIIGEGEAWLTELSTDQIRDLIRLSPEAVVES